MSLTEAERPGPLPGPGDSRFNLCRVQFVRSQDSRSIGLGGRVMSEGLLRLGKVIGIVFVVLGVVALVATVRGQSRQSGPMDMRAQILGGSGIGADFRDLDTADMTREKLASTAGAVVENVSADSPAARAGLKAGDVVTSFDGEKIRSARQLGR